MTNCVTAAVLLIPPGDGIFTADIIIVIIIRVKKVKAKVKVLPITGH